MLVRQSVFGLTQVQNFRRVILVTGVPPCAQPFFGCLVVRTVRMILTDGDSLLGSIESFYLAETLKSALLQTDPGPWASVK